MIRTDRQLEKSKKRLDEVLCEIRDCKANYEGDALELRLFPLVDEANELESEIEEYEALISMDFDQAVQKILRQSPILMDRIGDLLAKLRIALGITQIDLAKRLGWHQSNVSRFESENYSSHSLSKVLDYADALGVFLYVFPSVEEVVSDSIFPRPIFQTRKTISAKEGKSLGRVRSESFLKFESLASGVILDVFNFDVSSDSDIAIRLKLVDKDTEDRVSFTDVQSASMDNDAADAGTLYIEKQKILA